MYPILRPILNRGGAGRSLSRAETVEMLVPLVRRHQELIFAYDAALRHVADRGIANEIEPVMNRLRTELMKLRETVHALGGTASSGVDIDREAVLSGRHDGEILHALHEAERAYRDAIDEVLEYPHHQMRTIAILENNRAGSEARLGILHPIVTRTPRTGRRATATARNPITEAPADLPHTEHHAGPDEQPMIGKGDADPIDDKAGL